MSTDKGVWHLVVTRAKTGLARVRRGQKGQVQERQSLAGKVKNAVWAQFIQLLTVNSRHQLRTRLFEGGVEPHGGEW